ncbi:hypothetical protein M1B72_07170 [Geomonas paludis]|uniref:Uncharacterized protein n=1 Tax=Geomonas paludis TaxID=2740185 RepID=A0ABY4LLU3_9BACT|nr:hypothetical protein [Geomonas paludis]UPU37478.1 hypothetical protein M1B72_07170 [Geomonas paludis]
MNDNMMWMVAQLEKNGLSVGIGCSHAGWLVSAADGSEIVRYHSAREVNSFLAGLLFGATTMAQQVIR